MYTICLFSYGRVSTAHARRISAFILYRHGPKTLARPSIAFSGETAGIRGSIPGRQNAVYFSSKDSDPGKGKKTQKSKEYKVNPNIDQSNTDKLAAAFDDLAKQEGFDNSMAFYADDETFEDDFIYDDSVNDDSAVERELNPHDFVVNDFEEVDGNDGGGDDNFLDFGPGENQDRAEQSMEERIAAARRDMDLGRISVSDDLDSFARDATSAELRRLGYKREANPFGNDETPRKEKFTLVSNAMSCSACGADFQCSNDHRPGYLPPTSSPHK
jgi:hypothetical protein